MTASYRSIKRWLIVAGAQLKTDLAIPDDDWEVFGGNECLRVHPASGSKPVNDFAGGASPAIKFQGGGSTFTPLLVNRRFDIRLNEGRDVIHRALRTLANRSLSSGFERLVVLTVFDFAYPEEVDEVAAVAGEYEAYTQRQGLITLQPVGVKVGDSVGDQFRSGGIDFTFQESVQRAVF